jgi:hypothetical protein
MADSLKKPANPDWQHTNNNLAILYALTAKYPERDRFQEQLSTIDNPESLDAAQKILIRSGAVSYCAYHVIRRYQAARRLLDGTPLIDRTPLDIMLARQMNPVITLLHTVGAAIPPELQGLTSEESR